MEHTSEMSRRGMMRAVGASALAAGAAGASSDASARAAQDGGAAAGASSDASASSGGASAGYTNPVIGANHPDPAVIRADGRYYLYSTAGEDGNMPVLRSDDLVDWELIGDAMPEIASWSRHGRHWAPEVIEIDGKYHAYYTAWKADTDHQALGVAVSDAPEGPFVDDAVAPLVDTVEEGGAIDASPFRDDQGRLHLLWKNDGNHIGVESHIYAQQLTRDGKRRIGQRQLIISMDQDWERYTIEGATIVSAEGRYYLFYSAGEFWNESYGVGYAVSDSLRGPWAKGETNPLLSANEVAAGPGHGFPIRCGDQWWYIYHAWEPEAIGEEPGRLVWLSRLDFTDGVPTMEGPAVENPVAPDC